MGVIGIGAPPAQLRRPPASSSIGTSGRTTRRLFQRLPPSRCSARTCAGALGLGVRIARHAVERQRPHASGLAELMSISLLKPSPCSRNVRAQPGRSARQRARVERQRDLVAGLRRRRTSRRPPRAAAHVALARVAAGQRLPRRDAARPARSRSPTARGRPGASPPRSRARASGGASAGSSAVGSSADGRAAGAADHEPDPSRCAWSSTRRTSRLAESRAVPARSTATVCGRPTGMPICSTTVRHEPSASRTSQRRRLARQARLVRGDVVAREGVVGPAGQQQHACAARPAAPRSSVSACCSA